LLNYGGKDATLEHASVTRFVLTTFSREIE